MSLNLDNIITRLQTVIAEKLADFETVIVKKLTDSQIVGKVVDTAIDEAKEKIKNYVYIVIALYSLLVILLLFIIYLLYKRR